MKENTAALDLILNRRSIRAYRPDPLPADALATITEAGRHAPSSMNRQLNRFYVITDPRLLLDISRTVGEQLPGFAGRDCRYGAPALVLVTNSRQNPCALQDASCAMENMMLAAAALGLGSCWINQPFHLRENPAMLSLLAGIGVGEDELVCASLSVGYAAETLFPGPKEHPGNQVFLIGEA